MLRTFAILFGIGLIVIGILGFLPDFAPGGLLFNTFKVNPMLNILHLVSGIIALLSGMSNRSASKLYFIFFGLTYAALGILGFMGGDAILLKTFVNNNANSWLHTGIGVVSLYLGTFFKG